MSVTVTAEPSSGMEEGGQRPRWRRLPKPLRIATVVAGAWVGVYLAFNAVLLLAGVAARSAGKDPRLDDDNWPAIANLRMVDDQLLVGGQATPQDYRELAAKGVTLVIDMRPGADRGPDHDDEVALVALGLRYETVPVVDGYAPTPAQTRRFLELVDGNDGLVFAHCGGGVGRSTSIAATYQAANGQDPSVLEQLATGPPTLEQVWYVATLDPGHPEHGISPFVATVSRIVDTPRTIFNAVKSWL